MIIDEQRGHVRQLNLCPASFSRTQQAHPPHQPATPTEPKTVQFHCTLVRWWIGLDGGWTKVMEEEKVHWTALQWMVLLAKLPVAACLCFAAPQSSVPHTSHSARSWGRSVVVVPTDRQSGNIARTFHYNQRNSLWAFDVYLVLPE